MLVGLGNPGLEYNYTRHNVGFMVLDLVAQVHSFGSFVSKSSFLISVGRVEGSRLVLIKPTTFMNNSGQAVLSAASFYKISLDQVMVVHDDADLQFGDIKIKKGGGSAGHNGLKSIDAAVGKEYWRLRIGVGRSAFPGQDLASFVLSKFDNLDAAEEMCKSIAINIADIFFKKRR